MALSGKHTASRTAMRVAVLFLLCTIFLSQPAKAILLNADLLILQGLAGLWPLLTITLSSPCSSTGITCSGVATDLNQRVISINWNQASLNGTIPSSLLQLSQLTSLSLANAGLSGTIPSGLSGLTMLKTLNISKNALTGTLSSSLPPLLTTLDLSNNSLSGELPNLSALPLMTLKLANNAFSGKVPVSLSSLSSLTSLNLAGNALDICNTNLASLPAGLTPATCLLSGQTGASTCSGFNCSLAYQNCTIDAVVCQVASVVPVIVNLPISLPIPPITIDLPIPPVTVDIPISLPIPPIAIDIPISLPPVSVDIPISLPPITIDIPISLPPVTIDLPPVSLPPIDLLPPITLIPPVSIPIAAPLNLAPPSSCGSSAPVTGMLCTSDLSWVLNRTLNLADSSTVVVSSRATIQGDLILSNGSSIEVQDSVTVEGNFELPDGSYIAFGNWGFSNSNKRDESSTSDASSASSPRMNVTGCAVINGTVYVDLTRAEAAALASNSSRRVYLIESGCNDIEATAIETRVTDSDCTEVTANPYTEKKSGRTTLASTFTVVDSCKDGSKKSKTWWIVLSSVVGGVIVLTGVAVVLFFKSHDFRKKVTPFHTARTGRDSRSVTKFSSEMQSGSGSSSDYGTSDELMPSDDEDDSEVEQKGHYRPRR